jgi:hypothetical protein
MGIDRFPLVGALALAVGLGGLTACGDDSGSAGTDAATDGGENPLAGCTYVETADTTNELLANAEASGTTVSATSIVLCGTINNGHYDAANDVVDGDYFIFEVTTATDILIRSTGTGLTTPEQVVMQVNQQGSFDFFGFTSVVGDHGTIATHLEPGEYTIAIGGLHPQDLTAPVAYRLTISTDTPATRCPKQTGTLTFLEAGDGAGSGNDVIEYYAIGNPNSDLTSDTTDTAESTGITVEPASKYLVTGESANVNPADNYMDRDTFQFTTGASTNEMSVRLNWTSTAIDFDFRVYPATGPLLSIVGGLDPDPMEDEFETFAVKPNTSYWLWIAAEDGSTAPADYAATLCGEQFTP